MNAASCSILVDAVGTLIVPQPAAAETYCRIATQHGIQRDADRVAIRLRTEIAERQRVAAEHPTSPIAERQLWRQVVQHSLELDDSAVETVFPYLWDAFADPRHWATVPDAVQAITRLRDRGFRIAIASNFDARLSQLWSRWPALPQGLPIFTCEAIGWRKPHTSFYQHIDKQLPPGPRIMIGDELIADVLAPCEFGWQSIWLSADEPASPLPPNAQRAANWHDALEIILHPPACGQRRE